MNLVLMHRATVTFALILLVAPIGNYANALSGPGLLPGNALEITSGRYSFDYSTPPQWFKIRAQAGQTVSILLSAPDNGILNVYLFSPSIDPVGAAGLVASAEGIDSGATRSIVYVAQKPGYFYIKVGGSEVKEELPPPVTPESESPKESRETRGTLGRCLNVYRQAVGSAKRILTEARMGKIPSLAEAQSAVSGLVDGVLQDQNVMLALTMIKSYDEYLFNHSVNVCVLCIALAQSLGVDSETIKEVGLGALLHDIGKVHWPESLYQKPRGLSDEEWALVQRHPLDGAEIVEKMGGVSPTAREVILEHHLRYDRKGYPVVDPEKEPGFFGMIAQVADAYDAITTARVYQNAFEPTNAVARMQSLGGTVFDPKLLEVFVRLVGIYPVGSLVRLNSGELALVVKANPADPSRPFVRLLFDRSGRRFAEEQDVDLTELDAESGRFRRTIIMAVDPASKNFDVAKYLAAKGEAEAAASSGG